MTATREKRCLPEMTPEDRMYENEMDLWMFIRHEIESGKREIVLDDLKGLASFFSYIPGGFFQQLVLGSDFAKHLAKQMGVEMPKGFTRYSKKIPDYSGFGLQGLAYKCHECEKIIVGVPGVEQLSKGSRLYSGLGSAMRPRQGLKYTCKNPKCKKMMVELLL